MSNLLKYMLILFCIAMTSFYYFPIEFKAFLGVNTKQMMAVLGVLILGYRLATGKGLGKGIVQKDFFVLACLAMIVSLAGVFSVSINGTSDYAYATYIMSFLVWIAGAYAVCSTVKYVHGTCSIPLVVNYLIVVCVIQCIMALWIDLSPSLKQFVDAYIEQDQDFLNSRNVHRLYGIGASLDTAGVRFSIVQVLIAYLVFNLENTTKRANIKYYLLAFAIIVVIGNMIARTTIVGAGLGLAFIGFQSWERGLVISNRTKRVWKWFFITLMIAIPIGVYYYNNDATIHKHIRFAFEGFFNYFERGKWETTSTDRLQTMYVWPDNLKTWIMGDGYFSSPRNDPYFIGKIVGGYYMGTDVGYCRFIFYFGLAGLSLFTLFLWNVCRICFTRFKGTTYIFLMILLCNFVIWFKVSTDVFLAFALFLCIGAEENEEYMKSIELEEDK